MHSQSQRKIDDLAHQMMNRARVGLITTEESLMRMGFTYPDIQTFGPRAVEKAARMAADEGLSDEFKGIQNSVYTQ